MSGVQQMIAVLAASFVTLVGIILQWVKHRRPIRARKMLSAIRGSCPHWDLDPSSTGVKGLGYTSTLMSTDRGVVCWECGHIANQGYFDSTIKEWRERFKEDFESGCDMYFKCIKRRNALQDKFGRKGYSADEADAGA